MSNLKKESERRLAFIIGNSEAKKIDEFPMLNAPEQNAKNLAKAFKERGKFDFYGDRPSLLATQNRVLRKELKYFFTEEANTLLFYYSGYVFWLDEELCLVCKDTQAELVIDAQLSISKLATLIRESPADNVVVIIDGYYTSTTNGYISSPPENPSKVVAKSLWQAVNSPTNNNILSIPDPIALSNVLQQNFNNDEIKTLCFNLGIDYESLPEQQTKSSKARELVLYAQRYQKTELLVEEILRQRPSVSKESIITSDVHPDKTNQQFDPRSFKVMASLNPLLEESPAEDMSPFSRFLHKGIMDGIKEADWNGNSYVNDNELFNYAVKEMDKANITTPSTSMEPESYVATLAYGFLNLVKVCEVLKAIQDDTGERFLRELFDILNSIKENEWNTIENKGCLVCIREELTRLAELKLNTRITVFCNDIKEIIQKPITDYKLKTKAEEAHQALEEGKFLTLMEKLGDIFNDQELTNRDKQDIGSIIFTLDNIQDPQQSNTNFQSYKEQTNQQLQERQDEINELKNQLADNHSQKSSSFTQKLPMISNILLFLGGGVSAITTWLALDRTRDLYELVPTLYAQSLLEIQRFETISLTLTLFLILFFIWSLTRLLWSSR